MSEAQVLVVKTVAVVAALVLICMVVAPAVIIVLCTSIGVGLGGMVIGLVVPVVILLVKFAGPVLLLAGVILLLKLR